PAREPPATEPEASEPAWEPAAAFEGASKPAWEPEAAFGEPASAEAEFASAGGASSEDAFDEPEPTASTRSFSERGSQPPSSGRSFAPPASDNDLLRPVGADLPIRPGAPAPEQPAAPSGFAIDNSLAGGLVRPHTVWSPVAPPLREPRPSSGLFDYAAGPIPIPTRPPRPDLDPSLRVSRAPTPIHEGEPPTHSEAPPAQAPRHRRVDYDDVMMADAVDFDPISADE
ncbi:MAG: hypothetical protein H5U40_11240, partial [Polyangiaceae bacterium]|nr:hypothetical protein [Polyangiaceae bacterium]